MEYTKSLMIKLSSFIIEKHKKIAFIGESGSGKSTIFSLIRGLHSPNSVQVYCDRKRFKGRLAYLYDYVTLIPQEPEIFNTTIEDNITMGIKTNSKDLQDVIETARFDTVISRLTKGLKTNVMEKGISLSGGEKQRLALARGLLAAKDSELLVLDEPTSSVDSENELLIYQNIFQKYQDKTIIAALHRLHLLQYFDYIYYLKDGKIVGEGNLKTLLDNENFRMIWERYNKQIQDE